MRVLELPGGATPREWGLLHGEQFAGEIRSLVELRVYLTRKVGGFPSADDVLRVAAAHLPILEEYDADLYVELCAIADGAGVTPAEIVVLNHYTDLRDLDPSVIPSQDDGCSVIFARTAQGNILAQTWDMHATAIPYVMMIRTPEAWMLSLTGCLGMAGVNRRGVAIAINNLHSKDAHLGVVWSALVRRALMAESAAAARDVVMNSPVGSGHHYLVADPEQAYGIETSGELREIVFTSLGEGADCFVHTNHCLLESVSARSRVPDSSSTYDRYDWLSASAAKAPVTGMHDVWQRLGSHEGYPRSVCTNMATPENPHGPATCAAIALRLSRGHIDVWAAGGFVHNVQPERFRFESPGDT